ADPNQDLYSYPWLLVFDIPENNIVSINILPEMPLNLDPRKRIAASTPCFGKESWSAIVRIRNEYEGFQKRKLWIKSQSERDLAHTRQHSLSAKFFARYNSSSLITTCFQK